MAGKYFNYKKEAAVFITCSSEHSGYRYQIFSHQLSTITQKKCLLNSFPRHYELDKQESLGDFLLKNVFNSGSLYFDRLSQPNIHFLDIF